MYDFILYICTIIAGSFILDYNLLLTEITFDSLFSAIYFIKAFINNNLTESQILSTSNSLYCRGIIDRYIYYICVYLIYKAFIIFFWLDYLYFPSGLIVIPQIANLILKSPIFEMLLEKKDFIIRFR